MIGQQACHIHIESGALTLDYRACPAQARSVAEQLSRGTFGVSVTVDEFVTEDLPQLPCARLWH
ncbi:hypothetical protein ACWDSJ_25530 [Nocardia sp. NPDC003482]